MTSLLRQLPNALTTLRLLLAVPLCLLILREQHAAALGIAALAGLSDAVDGRLARRLDAATRYGAVVDPLADKALLNGAYISIAAVGLLPWWVAVLVLGRDLVIICGALAYHLLYGRYSMAPTIWGKLSTVVQVLLALVVLGNEAYRVTPAVVIEGLVYAMAVFAVTSGGHYVYLWGARAVAASRDASAGDQ
jgi:cardiolipin synthase